MKKTRQQKISAGRFFFALVGLLASVASLGALGGCGRLSKSDLTSDDQKALGMGGTSAQALLISTQTTLPALLDAAEREDTVKPQMPVEFGVLRQGLTEAQMTKLLEVAQSNLDTATKGCAKATKVDDSTFQIVFSSCAYGTSGKITVSGTIKVAVDIQQAARKITMTADLTAFKVNQTSFTGGLKVVVPFGRVLVVEFELVPNLKITSKSGAEQTLTGKGSIKIDKAAGLSTLNFTGTMAGQGTSYQVTAKELVTKQGEGLPSSGTITLVYAGTGPRGGTQTLVITFDEQTPTTGNVQVSLNGVSLGALSLSEIADSL